MMGHESDTEEELLVFAEVDGNLDCANYENVHVLGIDCNKPVIQMDDKFFTGTFEPALGTFMFFEEDIDKKCSDPVFDCQPDRMIKLVHTTNKYLAMKQAYILSKKESEPSVRTGDKTTEDVDIIHFESQEVALSKLKPLLDEIKDTKDKNVE